MSKPDLSDERAAFDAWDRRRPGGPYLYESEADAAFEVWCGALSEQRAEPAPQPSPGSGDIKAAYIKHFGGEAGWNERDGSFFTEGYMVALAAKPVSDAQEPLLELLTYCDTTDECQYGTLSSSLVRDLVNESLRRMK